MPPRKIDPPIVENEKFQAALEMPAMLAGIVKQNDAVFGKQGDLNAIGIELPIYERVFNHASDVRLPHNGDEICFNVPAGTEVQIPDIGLVELPTDVIGRKTIDYALLARWHAPRNSWIFLVCTIDSSQDAVWCTLSTSLSGPTTWEAIPDDMVSQTGPAR